MDHIQAVVFGMLQGLTEFLPISSSAHLVLLPWITGWEDPGLAFDVALHWGTLLAVLVYFWRDVAGFFQGGIRFLRGDRSPEACLPWQIAAATVPAAGFGFLFKAQAETLFRSPLLIAFMLAVFGILLFLSDRVGINLKYLKDLPWKNALTIGICQSFALLPGVSRSGITITLALLLGFRKTEAVKFSFFLSIPIIFGAGILEGDYILQHLNSPTLWTGFLAAAVSGYLTIHFLLSFVKTKSFMPFVIYRVALALLIILWPSG